MSQIGGRGAVITVLLLAAFALTACSSSNSNSPIDPETGEHPPNWIAAHQHAFIDIFPSDPSVCTECHGADLRGGISSVSCFTAGFGGVACHAGGPPGHPATNAWRFEEHGPNAKLAPGIHAGFSFCQICHGVDFRGGVVVKSCFTCHTTAPHAVPWARADLPFTHTTTDEQNTPVCAQCHLNRNNLPQTVIDALNLRGTFVFNAVEAGRGNFGCFNSTLCHGILSPHLDVPNWADPTVHGPVAKDAPGPSSGFGFCQTCHATDFTGGLSGLACSICHGIPAPHPSAWLPGPTDPFAHTNTNTGNANSCFSCHAGGENSPIPPPALPPAGTPPGCFNNTLCHGPLTADPRHDDPSWSVNHSNAARGLTLAVIQTDCGVCHGSVLTGGIGPSCFNCHLGGPVAGAGIMHPDRWSNPELQHPPFLNNIGTNAVSCSPVSPRGFNVAQYCHGQNLLATSVRVAPPNGSWGQAPSCFTCHGKEWAVP